MKKAGFWKTDWFFGIVVSVVMLILGNGELLQGLERKAYDKGVAATTRTPSDKVAVIAIDEQSIANIGRWPWSREIMAEMVEKLAAAKAKGEKLSRQELYASFRNPTSKTGAVIKRLEEEKASKGAKIDSDALLADLG